jgi:hypothetical protein
LARSNHSIVFDLAYCRVKDCLGGDCELAPANWADLAITTTNWDHSPATVDLDVMDWDLSLVLVNAMTDWDHLLAMVDLDATD